MRIVKSVSLPFELMQDINEFLNEDHEVEGFSDLVHKSVKEYMKERRNE